MNGWYPHMWFPPISIEEDVWCCVGALLVTLSVIYLQFTLNQQAYHGILQRYAIASGLHLVPLSFVFQQDNDLKHTSRLRKGYLTKKESNGVLHQMTWPPQSPKLNPIEMVWVELERRVKEKQPTSAQYLWELLQDCWKSIPGEAGWENTKIVQSCHWEHIIQFLWVTCLWKWFSLSQLLNLVMLIQIFTHVKFAENKCSWQWEDVYLYFFYI